MNIEVVGCNKCPLSQIMVSLRYFCNHPNLYSYLKEDRYGIPITPPNCLLLKEPLTISIKEQ